MGRRGHSFRALARFAGVVLLLISSTGAMSAADARANASSAVFVARSLNLDLKGQTATLLKDGTVLIAGGIDNNSVVQNAVEIYDPATGITTTLAATMVSARIGHTATLLNDGRVLIAGGTATSGGNALNTAELYNPSTKTFTSILGTMSAARAFHSATLLPNGTVLLSGGICSSTCVNGINSSNGVSYTMDIFDPTGETFTESGSTMTVQRENHTATLLNDGTVLILGGSSRSSSSNPVTTADLYFPEGDNLFQVGDMNDSREFHTATLLGDGTVLIAGGASGNNPMFTTNALPSAEIYDPVQQQFNLLSATMSDSRAAHTATLLQDGTVLIAGGYDDTLTDLASADIYDPSGQIFTRVGAQMGTVRSSSTATALVDGTVLLAGGATTANNSGNTKEVDLFDGTPGAFVPTGTMNEPRQFATSSMLQDGSDRVLITGGQNAAVGPLSSTELYDGASFSAAPVLTTPRSLHAVASFVNGASKQILITGGVTSAGGATDTAEIYTEQAGGAGSIAVTTNAMSDSRFGQTATLLSNGDVLVAGGEDSAGIVLATTDLFVPDGSGNGSFNISRVPVKGKLSSSSTSLKTARVYHTATTLCDGTVLIAGGRDPNGNYLNSIEIYDPTKDSFTTATSGKSGEMITARAFHTATLLPDCSVLLAGGMNSKGAVTSAELYIPGVNNGKTKTNGSFLAVGPMITARYFHNATALPDGTVLLAGGESADNVVNDSAEIYNPSLESFTPAAGLMLDGRYGATAILLNSGFVLFAGGADGTFATTGDSELYDPSSGPHPAGMLVNATPATDEAAARHQAHAGSLRITNQSNLFETLSGATITLSNPSLFSSLTLTTAIGGETDRLKYTSPAAVMSLIFDPPVQLAPNGGVALEFKARLAAKMHGQSSSQSIMAVEGTNAMGTAISSGLRVNLGTVMEK